MGLEKSYKNLSESRAILKMTLAIAFFLNLSTLNEWLQQKEATPTTATFLKLTRALNDVGEEFHLNSLRSSIRDRFFNRNQIAVAVIAAEMNPMKPDLPSDRKIAAIDPDPELLSEDGNSAEMDLIEDIVDDGTELKAKRGVLIVGDSILKSGLQEHFERNLSKRDETIVIEAKSQSGTGLSRPDVFDWISYVDSAKEQFEKVIVFLGTNDAQNLVVDKKVVVFDSKEWRTEYASRVHTLIQKACSKSKQMYWIGSLKMKSETFDSKMRALNEVVRQEIKAQPLCAQFVSVSNWFTRKSKYTDTWTTDSKKPGKKTVKMRVSDGIHLTYWGADIFSQKLIESIYE